MLMAWSRWKKVSVTVVGLAVVVGGILALKVVQIADLIGFAGAMEEAGMPPTPVATALATADSWEDTEEFTGTLRAVQGVMLTAELNGKVTKIAVENGAEVKEGDILIELDTTQEKADFAAARARLGLAKVNLERSAGLIQKNIVAQSEYDAAASSYDEANAQVAQWEAVIAKKVIRAPFAGQVGIRQVNLGQTLRPGDELIPLHSSDPIYVEFAVPQTRLGKIFLGQDVRVYTDGLVEPVGGQVTAINPVVDEATRSARVQATLRNESGVLRAGQFGEVEVLMPKREEVLAIPASAVLAAAYGDSVYVIEEVDGREVAEQRFVKLGQRRGDFVAVEKGLEAGDRVVTAGAFKLTNGAPVTIDDAMQPEAKLEPTPKNS